jgi:hypothetical protein
VVKTTIHLPGEPMPRLPVKQTAPQRSRRVVERYRAEDRLPLGSREVGYVLTREGFTKADIDLVEDVLVRARD